MHEFRFHARTVFLAIIAALIMTMMAPLASFAGSRGSRNTAIGLAGLSAFLLARGKTAPGVVAAIGAGYALAQSQQDCRDNRYCDKDRFYYGYRDSGHDWYRYNDRRHDRNCYQNNNYRCRVRVVVPVHPGHRW